MAIRHLVLLRFSDTTPPVQVQALVAAFAQLPRHIPGITGFEHGHNISPEGLDRGFTHAVVLSFADAAARDAYLPHPAHQDFVARLKPALADVLVLDYAV